MRCVYTCSWKSTEPRQKYRSIVETMGRVDDRAHGDGLAAFRVQNQIRRNAQDMQEYLADLGTWEESIKKKDKCVISQ